MEAGGEGDAERLAGLLDVGYNRAAWRDGIMTGRGRVLVNTGDGKGKTTAAIGLAVRAVGHGLRVLIVQFIKGDWPTGELRALERLAPELRIVPMGKGFTWKHENVDQDRAAAAQAWAACLEAMSGEEWDVLIMDEINYAIGYGFVDPADVVKAIKDRRPEQHVVLTGRGAHPDIVELADTVTEMRSVKHTFAERRGRAELGIEF